MKTKEKNKISDAESVESLAEGKDIPYNESSVKQEVEKPVSTPKVTTEKTGKGLAVNSIFGDVEVSYLPESHRLYKPSSIFYRWYFEDLRNRTVSVPISIRNSQFMFDYYSTISTVLDDAEELSDATMNLILKTVISTFDILDTQQVTSQLYEMGLVSAKANSENIDKLVQKIRENILRDAMKTGLSNVLVQTMVSETDRKPFNLSALASLNFLDVTSIVDWVAKFYSMYIRNDAGDVLAQALMTRSSSDKILMAGRSLYKLFRQADTAFVQLKASYVYDTFFQSIFSKPLIDIEEVLPAKISKVKSSYFFKDFSQVDVVSQYLRSIYASMGVKNSDSDDESLSVTDMVNLIVSGVGTFAAFVPSEWGKPDTSKLNDLYRLVYIYHFIDNFVTDNPGYLYASVMGGIRSNRFFNMEGIQDTFSEELYVLSAAYEAFIQTSAFLKELMYSPDIDWYGQDGLSEFKRSKIKDFFDKQIMSRIGDNAFGMDHPAYFKQPNHVINASGNKIPVKPLIPSIQIGRGSFENSPLVLTSPQGDHYMRIAVGDIDGNLYDLPKQPISPILANKVGKLKLIQFIDISASDPFLQTQLVKFKYNHYSFNKLITLLQNNSEISDFVFRSCKIERFIDAEDMSRTWRIPLSLANKIFSGGSSLTDSTDSDIASENKFANNMRFYADLSSLPNHLLFFNDSNNIKMIDEHIVVSNVYRDIRVRSSVPLLVTQKDSIIVGYDALSFGGISTQSVRDRGSALSDYDDVYSKSNDTKLIGYRQDPNVESVEDVSGLDASITLEGMLSEGKNTSDVTAKKSRKTGQRNVK